MVDQPYLVDFFLGICLKQLLADGGNGRVGGMVGQSVEVATEGEAHSFGRIFSFFPDSHTVG